MHNGHTFEAIFFKHRDFDGLVHAAHCYVRVNIEGDPSNFWGTTPSPHLSHGKAPVASKDDGEEGVLEDFPPLDGNLAEDMANFRNQGFNVNNDREPAPKNIPTETETTNQDSGLKEGQSWGWDGIDRRAMVKPEKEGHTFKHNFSPYGASFSEVLLHFLPLSFFADTELSNTKDAIVALGEPELVWREFLRFVGILALMVIVSGFKRDNFWCVDCTFDQRENHCPYRFNPYMSKR
jgi:hypothetical protein